LKEFQLLSLNLEDNNYKCKGNFCPYFLRSWVPYFGNILPLCGFAHSSYHRDRLFFVCH
jgi:hypothetical protein